MNRFEFYYNYAQSQLLEQSDRLRFTRTVAMSFMTLNLALLGVTWLILADLKQGFNYGDIASWMFAMAIALSFVLSIFYSMKTLYLASWQVGAHPRELHALTADAQYSDEQIAEWTAETMTEAYRLNDAILDGKAVDLRRVIFWFWAAAVFVIALSVSAII